MTRERWNYRKKTLEKNLREYILLERAQFI